jgi:alpha-ribazole phosphatase
MLAPAAAAVRAEIPAALRGDAPIYTSPLSRCRELARELAAPLDPVVSSDLTELSFGAWEGLSWDAVPRRELDAWAADAWAYRPGGGESAAMAAARWQQWARALRNSGASAALAITHAGLIRVALACEGLLSRESFASHPIPFCSVHRIALEHNPHDTRLSA